MFPAKQRRKRDYGKGAGKVKAKITTANKPRRGGLGPAVSKGFPKHERITKKTASAVFFGRGDDRPDPKDSPGALAYQKGSMGKLARGETGAPRGTPGKPFASPMYSFSPYPVFSLSRKQISQGIPGKTRLPKKTATPETALR